MPWHLRKKPSHKLWWVVDDGGKHYSKEALPRERAEAQLKALYATSYYNKKTRKATTVGGYKVKKTLRKHS